MRKSIFAIQKYANGRWTHLRYEVTPDAAGAMLRFLRIHRDPECDPNALRVVWYAYADHPGIPAFPRPQWAAQDH